LLSFLQQAGRAGLDILRRPLAKAFGPVETPLNHLGSLTIFFCWIVLISGIWLFIFFRTSVSGAFESVAYLTREQWYLGGIMRSLHRYASDGAIVTIFLHVCKEFSFDAYRGKRWFTWITGMPLVWMVFTLGITGYWLVWDQLAQYVAITSAELLDRVPIFTNSMAANFLTDAALSDRFFTLMAFLHLIGLPIFLVFGIWLHLFRLSRANINPPRRLMAGTLLALLVLAAIFPAESQLKANMALAPQSVELDWFYLHVYPLAQAWTPGLVWLLLLGISALLVVAPWLPRDNKKQAAVVNLDNCNGCQRCADDCPYSAIQMQPRSDGLKFETEAVVDPDLCVSCGICVGACPTASPFRSRSPLLPGIDLPALPAAAMREWMISAASTSAGDQRILSFTCRGSSLADELKAAGEAFVEVECMGQIPPPFIDYLLSRNVADGVFLAACKGNACHYRLGIEWTEHRIDRERDPRLRKRVDDRRIAVAWRDFPAQAGRVIDQIDAFRNSLPEPQPVRREVAA